MRLERATEEEAAVEAEGGLWRMLAEVVLGSHREVTA